MCPEINQVVWICQYAVPLQPEAHLKPRENSFSLVSAHILQPTGTGLKWRHPANITGIWKEIDA
jgi:hypothetical protein